MGNVPISCCRSKSPRLDSDTNINGINAQYTSNDHDSSARRILSSKSNRGSTSGGNESFTDQTKSLQTSSQNILQHISEREPDDSETDPSSNPLNRPIFATRSTCSKREHCKLSASSSTSNYNDSYSSNFSSSLARKQLVQNTPLTNSQDQGYNSSASTNLTHYDGNLVATTATMSTSFGGNGITKEDQPQRIVDKINEQIHGLNMPRNGSTGNGSLASPSESSTNNKSPIPTNLPKPEINNQFEVMLSKRRYRSGASPVVGGEMPEDRLKASSCSTIFIDDSTISQPNLDQTIKCVSLAIHYHIQDRTSDDMVEIFDESIHPLKVPSQLPELSEGKTPSKGELIILDANQTGTNDKAMTRETKKKTIEDKPNFDEEPDQETIHEFVKTLFKAAQLTSEYAITTLVYLERLMTYAEIDLTPKTWRRMFLGAILLSSKVWEDQAVWNVDYAQILEEISVDDINELERQFLELIQFNMNVPSSVYAKYYFHLRTLALKNGLTDEQTILTNGKARDLEAMSKVSAATGEWFSSTIERKVTDNKSMKKHTSLEKLRLSGQARAVLMIISNVFRCSQHQGLELYVTS